MIQLPLPLFPSDPNLQGTELTVCYSEAQLAIFHNAWPIFMCSRDDQQIKRVGVAILYTAGSATAKPLAEAFDISEATVYRCVKKYNQGGVAALMNQSRGHRSPHKLTESTQRKAQQLLKSGKSIRQTARILGVSDTCIRHGISKGWLNLLSNKKKRGVSKPSALPSSVEQEQPALFSAEDGEAPETVTARSLIAPEKTIQEVPDTEQVLSQAELPDQTDRSAGEPARTLQDLQRPSERSALDRDCSIGVAVKRYSERCAARFGRLEEAKPLFPPVEGVPGGGVLLALPALLHQGLLSVGQTVFEQLKPGFFGLQSIILTLAFMALLRIKTVEQLTEYAPGELGLLLGLDRVPEVRTLRYKLKELGDQKRGIQWAEELTKYWLSLDRTPDTLGFFYVDGHVRAYHGDKHDLPKTHVARRRLCMPATTDFWVNTTQAEPLFFITAPANDHLLSMLEHKVIPQIRKNIPAEQRLTLIFDREGWSPEAFQRWSTQGIDVLTYRKGRYEEWSTDCFMEVKGTMEGRSFTYKLSERSILILPGFWMREVRRLCDSGHQTAILTTRQDLSITVLAYRMFSRWQQENFFRYMRQDFNLDHQPSYAVEQADVKRQVPNPAIKALTKERKKISSALGKLNKLYVKLSDPCLEGKKGAYHGEKISKEEAFAQIAVLQQQDDRLKSQLKELPAKVSLDSVKDKEGIVKLELERKRIVDQLKMLAYRAETELVSLLGPIFNRHEDESRKFIESVFKRPVDLIPDESNQELIVQIHSLSNPRQNVCLQNLCEAVNGQSCVYPMTKLRLVFKLV